MNSLISINNLNFNYGPDQSDNNFEFGLNNVSADIFEKDIIGIIGESGSGKTSFAKIIAKLLEPNNGSIHYNFNFNSRISPIQMLFQNNENLLNPSRKVSKILTDTIKECDINYYLDLLKISPKLLGQLSFELSGGERQRVALAVLIATKPKLLILDEPFSAQDAQSIESLKKIIFNIYSEFKTTIICITHKIDSLRKLANRIFVFLNGNIVENANCNQLFNTPKHPYTKFLLKSEEYKLNKQDFQYNHFLNATCPFYSRCTIAKDICKKDIRQFNFNDQIVKCNFVE